MDPNLQTALRRELGEDVFSGLAGSGPLASLDRESRDRLFGAPCPRSFSQRHPRPRSPPQAWPPPAEVPSGRVPETAEVRAPVVDSNMEKKKRRKRRR